MHTHTHIHTDVQTYVLMYIYTYTCIYSLCDGQDGDTEDIHMYVKCFEFELAGRKQSEEIFLLADG